MISSTHIYITRHESPVSVSHAARRPCPFLPPVRLEMKGSFDSPEVTVTSCLCVRRRDISKDKEKCEGEDEEGKEQSTPRGRKTANSQGRRKGRITTRSMANEAASTATEEPSAPAPPPPPPPPPEPGKAHTHITDTQPSLEVLRYWFNR